MSAAVTPMIVGSNPLPTVLTNLGGYQGPRVLPFGRTRIVLLGGPKVGKTNFVCSDKRSIVLDIRGGAHAVQRGRACVIAIPDWQTYIKTITELCAAKRAGKLNDFDRVVIDVGNEWQQLLSSYIIDMHNSRKSSVADHAKSIGELGQNGWTQLKNLGLDHLTLIYDAGFGWTVTGHLFEKRVTEDGPLVRDPAIKGGIKEFLFTDNDIFAVLEKLETTSDVTRQETRTIAGKPTVVDVPVKGPDGRIMRQSKLSFCLDARQSNCAMPCGSRVPIQSVIEYPQIDPANPVFGMDLLAEKYTDAAKLVDASYK